MSAAAFIAVVIGGLAALCSIAGVILAIDETDGSTATGDSTAARPAAEEAPGNAAGPNAPGNGAAPPAKADPDPGIGTPARDGKFEFVVSKVNCGQSSVGSDFLSEEAQGQFCLVSMSVKNIGDRPRTLDASSQYAYDPSDRKFDADGVASMYANDNNELFLNDINPGNQVDAVLVFDLPKDAKPAKLELHDSPFSGGVVVRIA